MPAWACLGCLPANQCNAGEKETAEQRAARLEREAEARRAAAGEKEQEAARKIKEVGSICARRCAR